MFPLFLVLFGSASHQDIGSGVRRALVILFNVAYGVMNARKTRFWPRA